MLLTDARRAARTTSEGGLVPLAEQDRQLWDRASITEGIALLTNALSQTPIGPYHGASNTERARKALPLIARRTPDASFLTRIK